MAYEMVMPYHLHMPSYFLETFTEYPLSTICIMNKGVSHDSPLFFYVKTSVLKTKQEDLAYFFPYPGV